MDCYGILEIERNAKPHEIKKAYYNLSKKHHPDVGGNEETFKMIAEAYQILSDPVKREMYDRDGTILNDTELMLSEWVKNTFVQMIQTWVKAKIDGDHVKTFPDYVLDKIEENTQNALDGIETIQDRKEELKKYDKFASVADGENIFEIALKGIRSDLDTLMRQYNTLLYRTKSLEEEFKRYEFAEMEDDEAMSFIQLFSTMQSGVNNPHQKYGDTVTFRRPV